MLLTNMVRRAGRLLGAVTVTGVLSAGLLATSPAAAQTSVNDDQVSVSANGLSVVSRAGIRSHINWANGI